ncbi:MAG: ABC transporter permease [Lachnospiraceae bacterium]|nr:ABC transporter permease [Lachnospiraceae bacterium]
MFFRMLKKDITEKKALNIILLLFMCFASILTVCSAIVLLSNTFSMKETRNRIKASEVTIVSDRDLKDSAKRQETILEFFKGKENVEDIELSETIIFRSNAVDYVGFEEDSAASIINNLSYAFDLSDNHNLVTDLDGNEIELGYGMAAISEYVQILTKMNVGDKVRLTTQLGNIYEFEIAAITKDPGINGWYRLFFNSEDFKVLKEDSPVISDVYMIDLVNGATNMEQTQIINDFTDREDDFGSIICSYTMNGYNSAALSSVVLNVMLIIVSFFLIVMVFMTISFTIKTAIKNEEKELGMLKALGVESVSFNWLFAAKYLFIASISTVAGFFGGIHLSGLTIKYILHGQLKPSLVPTVVVALSAALMEFAIILFFVGVSLRRMKKISIMDVIAGENRGERFKKLSGLYLHRIKNINIPLYLAITDLTNRIKRYSFLIIAYSMGFAMIIMALEIENTSNTAYWLEKTWAYPEFDFTTDFTDDMMETYIQRGGSLRGAYDIINKEIKEAGIPAHINYYNYCGNIKTTFHDKNIVTYFQFNRHPEDLEIYSGVAPKLKNEVLLDAYHASFHGIKIGDTIEVEYYKYNDDGITYDLVSEEFLVTGTFDVAGAEMIVVASDAFEGAARERTTDVGGRIEAPENEKAAYIEKLRELYGKTSVRTQDEEVKYQLHEMGDVYKIVLGILIPLIVFMMILVTILYQSVNIIDETPDIALLKCSGFENKSIKSWQIIRSILITAISALIAVILLNTGVYVFLRIMFYLLSNIVKYCPNRDVLKYYIGVPGLIIFAITIVLYFTLANVKKIELWKLRDN